MGLFPLNNANDLPFPDHSFILDCMFICKIPSPYVWASLVGDYSNIYFRSRFHLLTSFYHVLHTADTQHFEISSEIVTWLPNLSPTTPLGGLEEG